MSPSLQLSEPQLQANRANAAQSTGPRSAEGKSRSRNNAWSHGLTGQNACMPYEDRQAFDAFCATLVAALKPEGEIETPLAHSIAQDHWRINRIRAIETNIFAVSHSEDADEMENALNQARAFLENAQAFGLLSLYESRIARKISRNEVALRALQADRKAAFERALAEAELLAQVALDKGEVYDPRPDFPAPDGFVFSNEDLSRRLDRKRRLNEARAFAMNLQTRPAHLTM